MDRLAWPTAVRAVVGVLVACFVAGAVILVVLNLELISPRPEGTGDFASDFVAVFEWERTLWPMEFAGTVLFAVGFVALGMLGPLLAKLFDPADSRASIVSSSLLLAGGLGAASQLLWIGGRAETIRGELCECDFLAEEIMSRLVAQDVAGAVQTWLVNGAALAAAVGLILAAPIGVRAGMPAAWAMVSYAVAALAVVVAVLAAFGAYPFDLIATALASAVLLPAWAIWLAQRADALRLGGGASAPSSSESRSRR